MHLCHRRGSGGGLLVLVLAGLLGLLGPWGMESPVQAAQPGSRAARRGGRARKPPNRDAPRPPLRLADGTPEGEVKQPQALVAAPTSLDAAPAEPATPPAPASVPAAAAATPATPPPTAEAAAKPAEAAEEADVTCRAAAESGEPKVSCSDGKSWTMRSAGLILPPVLRCSSQHPECCQVGFRKLRDVQLADLLRVGEGQAPLCHMRVQDFLVNPPSQASASVDRLDDELPPTLRMHKDCPKGQYLALGACHDPKLLMRALRLPPLEDPNRPLVPEADEVVERMRREFNASGKCPQGALDIEVLQRVYNAAQLRAELVAGTPLDVTPLLGRAQSPGGSGAEPGLPASCGYNATFRTWYQTTYHCVSANMCFAQSHESLAHTCVRFDRATTPSGGSPYFWPMANCQNVPSCAAVANGQCTGVARLTALGRGIFLMIQEDPSGLPYYYGVLFARPRARSAAEAAEARRARALLSDMARNLSKESERVRLRQLLESIPE